MKKIYIVLTHTGTWLSRLIKMYTKDEFSHISIALDRDLQQMYSFGRLKPYNPIIGGFVHESIHYGTFKRFYKTKADIYSLEVTNEQYQNIRETIESFEKNKKEYSFNIIGLCAAGFRKKISIKNSFYCAEFVKYVLDKAEVITGLPEPVKPEQFKKINNLEKVYSGLLRKYNISKRKDNIKLQMEDMLMNNKGAKVVLSSSWRYTRKAKELRELLLNYGIYVDATPFLENKRGIEIKEWIKSHNDGVQQKDIDEIIQRLGRKKEREDKEELEL